MKRAIILLALCLLARLTLCENSLPHRQTSQNPTFDPISNNTAHYISNKRDIRAPPTSVAAYDIFCRNPPIPDTSPGRASVTIESFFSLEAPQLDYIQILGVSAKLAELMIKNDPQFSSLNFHVHLNSDTHQGDSYKFVYRQVYNLFQSQASNPTAISMLGPLSSAQTRLINGLVTVNTAPIVSYAATVPSLSSKFDYPWFFRVCYSDSERTQVFADLCKEFGWRKVILLSTSDLFGSAISHSFVSKLPIGSVVVYEYDKMQPEEVVRKIYESGLKVIFFLASADYFSMMDCAIIGKNCNNPQSLTFQNGYQWILADSFPLYHYPADPQYCEGLEGSIVVETGRMSKWTDAQKPGAVIPGTNVLISNLLEQAKQEFEDEFGQIYHPQHFWTQEYSPLVIDSIYVLAHAYNTLKLNQTKVTGCGLREVMSKLVFEGYSGLIAFDRNYDRNVSIFDLKTLPIKSSCSDVYDTRVRVGDWVSSRSSRISIRKEDWPVAWNGKVPDDGFELTIQSPPVNPIVGIVIAIIFVIITSGTTIAVHVLYRNHPAIKTGPPAFFLVVCLGICLSLFSIIPMTARPTNASCATQTLLAALGFSLVIAAFGTKSLVYELLNRGKIVAFKDGQAQISNARLVIFSVCAMLPTAFVTVLVLLTARPRPITSSKDATLIVCSSKSLAGQMAILCTAGITALATIVLAFRNRNTPNVGYDPKFILLASGNHTLLAGIAVGIAFILTKTNQTGSVLIILLIATILGAFGSWCLIMVPRLYKLYRAYKDGTLNQYQERASQQIPHSDNMELQQRDSSIVPLDQDMTQQLNEPLLSNED